MIKEVIENALFFLILINPVSKIVVVNVLSKTLKKTEKVHNLIVKSSVIAFFMLLVFAFAGKFILRDMFQIDINSLQFAGGIVLAVMGFRALDKGVFFQMVGNKNLLEMAIVPLASPLIAGPATITATILKASSISTVVVVLALFIAVVVNMLIALSSLNIAKWLDRYNLSGALIRITGLFIMSMGINMMFMAVKTFFVL